ncbi:F0F1 ATP synthase subunit gamma [Bacteroides ilei]|jgi:F-type H+-transporting ATPase subunit gamma|uniref:F0F1 ATP synthase subunit gamma n=1 Tax=Bacteroides ilei TaxID=1907658 RepID=UPI0009316CD1|nr:F0F1 ATP synthase subunit gamma [Bacteroides ilei]
MASLKEIKGRINSINGTLKITSAMKMVASSKLHKAQEAIENMLPYERRLHHMLTNFLSTELSVESPFIVNRDVTKIAIVVFASNSSLCGGFNSNVIRHLQELLDKYTHDYGKDNILVYPVGRKVADAVKKLGFTPMGDYVHMSGKPNYQEAADLAAELMDRFVKGEIQKVDLLYNHFKSTSTQILTHETYLPIDLSKEESAEGGKGGMEADYIIEPSAQKVMQELLPKVLRMKIYTVLLDSNAAEHAARTMAMQIATDNANDLIQELTLLYNKSRQQAITNELLDIIGGTMA